MKRNTLRGMVWAILGLSALTMAGLTACAKATPPGTAKTAPGASAVLTTASVTGGEIAGSAMDGVGVFKGVPFAAPPVGKNRWRAPQPVIPWHGIRQATQYGPTPMQNNLVAMFMGGGLGVKVSEDCLYLNVWTPAKHRGQKLPVMFWIYGGGFAAGSASSPGYDGTRLAKRGVVVVSVNYRVGPFGFLAYPALSRESGHGSGTYGLMDQIAGLRWVKNNIAQFGGNPHNVTIFGESAGGESTSMLAASPQAHGLFQRVICESGGQFSPTKRDNEFGLMVPSLTLAEQQGTQFLHGLGADNLAAARALPAEAIQQATAGLGIFPFWPARDGYVLPDDQYRMYEAGHFNDTPVLIGTNSDDGGAFSPAHVTSAQFVTLVRTDFGPTADAVLAVYPHATDDEATRATAHLVRDVIFAWGTWSWAKLQTQHGKGAAYLYYFDRHPPTSPNGSGHGSEVPYVFGYRGHVLGLSNPADEAFSNQMQGYWVNFARTGNPNGPGLPPWPAFREPNAKAQILGHNITTQPVPNLKQLQAIDAYFAWRRAAEPPAH